MSAARVSFQRQSSETCSPRVCPPDATGVRYGVPVDALRMLLSVHSVEREIPTHGPAMRMGPTTLDRCRSIRHTSHRAGDLVSPRVRWRGDLLSVVSRGLVRRIHDQLVDDHGGLWTRVARYHSATPHYVATYRRQLLEYALRWRAWLIAHYPTMVSSPGFHSAAAPARDVSREMPSGASHAERPPLATPRRTTAPVGLQALRARRRRATESSLPALHSTQMIGRGVKVCQMTPKLLIVQDTSGLQSRPQRFDSAPSLQQRIRARLIPGKCWFSSFGRWRRLKEPPPQSIIVCRSSGTPQ